MSALENRLKRLAEKAAQLAPPPEPGGPPGILVLSAEMLEPLSLPTKLDMLRVVRLRRDRRLRQARDRGEMVEDHVGASRVRFLSEEYLSLLSPEARAELEDLVNRLRSPAPSGPAAQEGPTTVPDAQADPTPASAPRARLRARQAP